MQKGKKEIDSKTIAEEVKRVRRKEEEEKKAQEEAQKRKQELFELILRIASDEGLNKNMNKVPEYARFTIAGSDFPGIMLLSGKIGLRYDALGDRPLVNLFGVLSVEPGDQQRGRIVLRKFRMNELHDGHGTTIEVHADTFVEELVWVVRGNSPVATGDNGYSLYNQLVPSLIGSVTAESLAKEVYPKNILEKVDAVIRAILNYLSKV